MSGGVDSSAAALLLKEQGYEVLGVTLLLRPDAVPDDPAGDAADARRVADALGIEHRTVDLRETFRRDVIEYFTAEYAAGRTPNPCVACNRRIKFGAMLDLALEYGCDGVATGHYARVERDPASGRWLLLRAPTPKDQSYVLYQLTQRQLSRAVFPLAAYAKPEIRALAQRAGLPVANRPDSQEICFVPGDDYGAFLQSRGIRPAPGSFVGLDGEILGTHRGIPFYTVGQRKGLGISFGRPMYVTKIDAELDRLRGRKASMKKGLDQVKSTLMLCMDKVGTRRIATATMTISIRKNPPTVVTADDFIDWAEQSGRDDLLRYARPEPDKRKIMDAIKAGDEIPAEIVQREGVVIK